MTTDMAPDASREEQSWLNDVQKQSMSPDGAVAVTRAIYDMDVKSILKSIRVPTLVVHQRDEGIPLEHARQMAASIPEAQFVVPEGRNHILLEHQNATREFLDELEGFLGR